MILTINFVDATTPVYKLLATCNLNIDTSEPDKIRDAYQETIPKIHTPNYKGNGADLLADMTRVVKQQYPEMMLLSVNEDRSLSAPLDYTLNIEKKRK